MSLEILSIIIAFLFISLIYLGRKLDRLEKSSTITLNHAMINSAITQMLTEALIEKKLLTQKDLLFLKQEEALEVPPESPPK